jgi:hypothetical protein
MRRNEFPAGSVGRRRRGLSPALVCCAALLLGGCAAPDRANIQLRKDKQELSDQIGALQRQLQASQAEIAGLRQGTGAAPTLPGDRLRRLFTVHRVEVGRFSGGADLDPRKAGDEGVKVYLTPLDEAGDPIKATGNAVIEVFDLARKTDNRIGRCEFGSDKLKQMWRGLGPLQAFVLVCPWQTPPLGREVAIHVSFTDELTGRLFSEVKGAQVNLPAAPATRPASPSTQPIAGQS